MSEWRVGSSWNLEAHRLKNRLRQQRYRARKREEKARRDAEIPVLADMSISSLPSISNGNSMTRHEEIIPFSLSDTEAKNNGTSSANDELRELNSSGQHVNSPIENESSRVRCIARPEDQQSHAELLQLETERISHNHLEGDQISDSTKIQNPQFLMEQACHLSNMNIDTIVATSGRDNGVSDSYIMARRLKNRERQRRYRARKRLEADMKRASLLNQNQSEILMVLPLQTQPNGVASLTRVHCGRKWKKDARMAHPPQHTEGGSSEKEEEDQPQISLQLGNAEIGVWVGCVTANGTQVGRRDWKMDARKKAV